MSYEVNLNCRRRQPTLPCSLPQVCIFADDDMWCGWKKLSKPALDLCQGIPPVWFLRSRNGNRRRINFYYVWERAATLTAEVVTASESSSIVPTASVSGSCYLFLSLTPNFLWCHTKIMNKIAFASLLYKCIYSTWLPALLLGFFFKAETLISQFSVNRFLHTRHSLQFSVFKRKLPKSPLSFSEIRSLRLYLRTRRLATVQGFLQLALPPGPFSSAANLGLEW